MSDLKSVKEVCEITGLNRKILFDYKDVVKPVAYKNYMVDGRDGYKLYDDEAIELLRAIAFYRELGMHQKEIKDLIVSGHHDYYTVLNTQVEKLEQEKKRLEEMIEVAKWHRSGGVIADFIKAFEISIDRNKFLNEDYISYCLNNTNALYGFMNSLESCDEKDLESAVEKNIKSYISTAGFAGFVSVSNIGTLPPRMLVKAGITIKEHYKKVISDWLINNIMEFLDEFIEIINCEEYSRMIIKLAKFKEEKVFEFVEKIKELCGKHFGMKSKEEFGFVLDAIKIPSEIKLTNDDIALWIFYYAVGALKFYNKTSD